MRKSVHTAEYAALRGRLVAVREGAGLSQRELGRVLGVPHTWVAKVESGERRIDLIEFGWFCRGCGVEAGEVAREVLGTVGRVTVSRAGAGNKDGRGAEPSPRPSPGVPGEGEEKRWAVPTLRERESGEEGGSVSGRGVGGERGDR